MPPGCLCLSESLSVMQAPEPQAVSQFVWELINFNRTNPGEWAVVHCTHGYNRTGGSSACASLHGPVGKTVWCAGTCALVMVPPCAPPYNMHTVSRPSPHMPRLYSCSAMW